MALSLESLYKPVNDFFLKKFQTIASSAVFFRFAKHAAIVSDEDFMDPPNNPEEEFSDFVNYVPEEDLDGLSILFLSKKIDESYRYELLSPSLPFVSPSTDDITKESIEKAFSEIYSRAIKKYDESGWQARRGVTNPFWLSKATPSNWYDRTNNEIWQQFTFQVTEPVTPAVNTGSESQLWKLRMDDSQLQKVMPVLQSSQPAKPNDLQKQVLLMKPFLATQGTPLLKPATKVVDHRTPHAGTTSPHNAMPRVGYVWVKDHWERDKVPTAGAEKLVTTITPAQQPVVKLRTPVQQNFHSAFIGLNFTDKIAVANYLKEKAPTQEVTSNNITISFDYCSVRIDRPWLADVFLENKYWYIPGYTKGELSASGNLSVLPTYFVAVKNLKIKANWTESDTEAVKKNPTDFGPFQIDSQIDESGNIEVGHEGIQVIGWILQRMHPLPPNDQPHQS